MSGTPIIYACNNSAINFLELLSIKGPVVSLAKWYLVTMEIKGEIPYLEPKDLPNDWNLRPYPKSTQRFGTNWAQEPMSACLKVPSCRIPIFRYPDEHNLLINPLYLDIQRFVKVKSVKEVEFELN